jgi:prepilin signal peptidase PulO-like enzyme (type II secretory pathway)
VTRLLLALAAALAGALLGLLTHRLNQALGAAEPEATGAPLPREALWAPILDGVLLGLLGFRLGVSATTLLEAAVTVALVQVLVFDARHRLILNRVIYPATLLAIVLIPVNPLLGDQIVVRLLSGGLGALIAGGVFLILVVASRGGVGLGDAKLTFFMGAALGIAPPGLNVIRALIYGVVLGAVAAALLLVSRRRGLRDYIAYGPYLCAGGVIAMLFPCGLLGPTSCG